MVLSRQWSAKLKDSTKQTSNRKGIEQVTKHSILNKPINEEYK